MKKLLSFIVLFACSMVLMGCPPVTTEPLFVETTPFSEMLFDLPEGVSIVSETFDLSLMNESLDESSIPNLQMTGRYVIQNDGEDTTLNMLYPSLIPDTFSAIDHIRQALDVKVNYMSQDLQWAFTRDLDQNDLPIRNTYSSYQNLMILDVRDPYLMDVYAYTFRCPMNDSFEELTLHLSENAFVLYDPYMSQISASAWQNVSPLHFSFDGTIAIIPGFDETTMVTIYSFDDPITFESNYDYQGSTVKESLANTVMNQGGNVYAAIYLGYLVDMLSSHGTQNTLDFQNYLFEVLYDVVQIRNLFTLTVDLPGNGAQTVLEVTFPPLRYGTEVQEDTRFLHYEFVMDYDRYQDQSIPVTFNINTEYDVFSNTYNIGTTKIISDFQIGYDLQFTFAMPYHEESDSK